MGDKVLYFAAISYTDDYGLWQTDGSQGAWLVKQLPRQPQAVARLRDKLIFSVTGTGASVDLWVSDDTAEGTQSYLTVQGGGA